MVALTTMRGSSQYGFLRGVNLRYISFFRKLMHPEKICGLDSRKQQKYWYIWVFLSIEEILTPWPIYGLGILQVMFW